MKAEDAVPREDKLILVRIRPLNCAPPKGTKLGGES